MGKKKWILWLAGFLAVIVVPLIQLAVGKAWELMFFLALISAGDNRADKMDIVAFVCGNEEALLTAIEEADFSDFENTGFIENIDVEGAVVVFSCGGAGVVPGTSYVGFYYTANGDLGPAWCAPDSMESMTPSGDGFIWFEENGDNSYYTERICGSFFYYEASF